MFRFLLVVSSFLILGCADEGGPNSGSSGSSATAESSKRAELLSKIKVTETELDSIGIAFKVERSTHTEGSGSYLDRNVYEVTTTKVAISVRPEFGTDKLKPIAEENRKAQVIGTELEAFVLLASRYYKETGEFLKMHPSETERAEYELKQNLLYQKTIPIAIEEIRAAVDRFDQSVREAGLSFDSGVTLLELAKDGIKVREARAKLQASRDNLTNSLSYFPRGLLARTTFESDSPRSYTADPFESLRRDFQFNENSSFAPNRPKTFAETYGDFVNGAVEINSGKKIALINVVLERTHDGMSSEEYRKTIAQLRAQALEQMIHGKEANDLKSSGIQFTADHTVDRGVYESHLRANRFVEGGGVLSGDRMQGYIALAKQSIEAYQVSGDSDALTKAAVLQKKVASLEDFLK